MKELPDEEVLLELFEEFKELEQAARKLSEMTTAFAYKWQKRASGSYAPESQKRSFEIIELESPTNS